ncbi:hypothetical protein DFH09DRAFT_1139418 [Mycena vulgaris]|nr:hypothetical protein DFH09DRAFT_1139418 [Mycena vulgaris]
MLLTTSILLLLCGILLTLFLTACRFRLRVVLETPASLSRIMDLTTRLELLLKQAREKEEAFEEQAKTFKEQAKAFKEHEKVVKAFEERDKEQSKTLIKLKEDLDLKTKGFGKQNEEHNQITKRLKQLEAQSKKRDKALRLICMTLLVPVYSSLLVKGLASYVFWHGVGLYPASLALTVKQLGYLNDQLEPLPHTQRFAKAQQLVDQWRSGPPSTYVRENCTSHAPSKRSIPELQLHCHPLFKFTGTSNPTRRYPKKHW